MIGMLWGILKLVSWWTSVSNSHTCNDSSDYVFLLWARMIEKAQHVVTWQN